MTINNFFSDVLSSIADAQYNSYVFSQQLGEQASDSLFPVPIAEIKEITFDMKFAYLPQ